LSLSHIFILTFNIMKGSSWPWSDGSWIYNYLCTSPINTEVVSSNTVHGEMYSIQHYVIKFLSGL